MLFAELRAKGWKYGAIACSALAVAALLACWFFRDRYVAADARADSAEQRAESLQGELRAAREAAKRDVVSDVATADARESGEQRASESRERVNRAEAIANEPRPPVPVVCPEPDGRLMRDLTEGSARLRTTEGRLRDLRPAGN